MSEMIKAGVIGHPVSHSKSPLIHNYWIKTYGLNGSYEAIDAAPENLKSEIRRLTDEGYQGFNVTVPHKEAILELCDKVDRSGSAKHRRSQYGCYPKWRIARHEYRWLWFLAQYMGRQSQILF